jgi:hypothetical protein
VDRDGDALRGNRVRPKERYAEPGAGFRGLLDVCEELAVLRERIASLVVSPSS